MKAADAEIERLRREVQKLKAERDILKKSRGLLRQGPDMMFAFVAKHRGIWPTATISEALGVSRSGVYAWLTRGPSARSRRDEALGAKIRSSFQDSDRSYGARRVWHDLLAAGIECGLHAIERLMRRNGLRARPRRGVCRSIWETDQRRLFRQTCSTAASRHRRPIANGWPTSPTSGQPRAG